MRFNPAIEQVPPYVGGRPIEEVARRYGVSDIVKLASNESPLPPFPEVQAVIAAGAANLHRYPDQDAHDLTIALARSLDIATDSLWIGAGSSELLGILGISAGGPGSKAVMGWPSFAMYPIATLRSGATPVRVPLTETLHHDLDAMAEAVDEHTSVVYVCNPNNPTGTLVDADTLAAFAGSLPDDVLVVVDEAYHEFVTVPGHRSALQSATGRRNLLVLRTFSKIYGLAGLRIGYAVGHPETVAYLRRPQRPFSVTQLAQDAAREALRHPDRVEERRRDNDVQRHALQTALVDRGLVSVPSHANFVHVDVGGDAERINEELLRRGVIVRLMGDALRVSVGSEIENRRFLLALDQVL